MDCVRTHGSVDKTRVASEICSHLRAICGRAAPGYKTAFRRTLAFKRRNEGADWGDVAFSGATEVILMVWLLERTRVSFTAVSSHFVQKSSTGAVANGARKFWRLTTVPRPLYQSSNSRNRGVIFLPRPHNWPQIIPDLTRCRAHWEAADSQATCIALSERQYSLTLETGSTETHASLNYQEMATVLWQQSGVWRVCRSMIMHQSYRLLNEFSRDEKSVQNFSWKP